MEVGEILLHHFTNSLNIILRVSELCSGWYSAFYLELACFIYFLQMVKSSIGTVQVNRNDHPRMWK